MPNNVTCRYYDEKQAKKKKKGLMCLQISVTNVMIPEEENAICTHTHTHKQYYHGNL